MFIQAYSLSFNVWILQSLFFFKKKVTIIDRKNINYCYSDKSCKLQAYLHDIKKVHVKVTLQNPNQYHKPLTWKLIVTKIYGLTLKR